MRLQVGLEKFNHALSNIEVKGNVDAWMEYYTFYRRPFSTIFKTLYMMDVESIKKMVRDSDLETLSEEARTALQMYTIEELKEIIKETADYYNFEAHYDAYLLVGLGQVDGTALPSEIPFLYLGLERLRNSDIEMLIQHEFNHLVRFNSIEEVNEEMGMTVGQLAIAEGLATLAPLVMSGLELNEANIREGLFVNDEEFNRLRDDFSTLQEELERDFNEPLSPKLHEKYFMYNEGNKYPKVGYFIGVHYIIPLLEAGYSLKELTRSKTKDILYKYTEMKRLL
ncbi:DUF2268 domain-containing putative Zn-dependent protease [Salinicoccus roseus]|uniref:DUF2268 domain-containing putative Zn-dependent protease n=1 Tax=Salinicoccus roseus TaxID=45670 RepID=UPI000F514211|nr:DUF2268 domain-containing putative Zn-dependent protease [Salinicoccus roseus]RPE51852.1 putative Zn-dependent protease DUF2268 [Salinicoccus roseus]GGA75544.1 hypothetical protein GCM10007176_19810 [Salinicoccus roseus]